jgi:multiple sugar transport system substrate-binding protein
MFGKEGREMKGFVRMAMVFVFFVAASVMGFAGAQSEKTTAMTNEVTVLGGNWVTEREWKQITDQFGYDVAQRFTDQTGIKVKMEVYPFQEMIQTIQVKMAAKDPSVDVLWVDGPLTANYAVHGWIRPLDDVYSAADLKDFYPATVSMATWDGKLYTAPYQTSSQLLYFNKTLFAKAGIEPPTMDVNKRWTWAQVVDAAIKIQKAVNTDNTHKYWGLVFNQISRPYQMLPLPQSLGGGSGVSPDGLHVDGYLNNEAWVKALKWWYDTHNTWDISPRGTGEMHPEDLFQAGQIAMFPGGTWLMPQYAQALKEGKLDLGVAPYPYFAGGKPVTPTNSWHLGISAYSKNVEAAGKFLRYLTSKESMKDSFIGNGQLVCNKVMTEVIATDPKYKVFPWDAFPKIVTYELANTAEARPTTPFYQEWESATFDAFQNVRNGGDPKTSLDQAVSVIENAAKKYR